MRTVCLLLLLRSAWALSSARGTMIEVERKFAPPASLEDLREKVVLMGGEVLGKSTFTDTYYDTPACDLARRDMWLRKRGGTWELKTPPRGVGAERSGGERTNFEEVLGPPAILAVLQDRLPKLFRNDYDMDTVLTRAGCAVFAEFDTTRARFRLRDCSVDVDAASFGYGVMEIEQMVSSTDDIPQAHASIQRIADLLGATPFSPTTGGKLECYIRRHCPAVLDILSDAGILSRDPDGDPAETS